MLLKVVNISKRSLPDIFFTLHFIMTVAHSIVIKNQSGVFYTVVLNQFWPQPFHLMNTLFLCYQLFKTAYNL